MTCAGALDGCPWVSNPPMRAGAVDMTRRRLPRHATGDDHRLDDDRKRRLQSVIPKAPACHSQSFISRGWGRGRSRRSRSCRRPASRTASTSLGRRNGGLTPEERVVVVEASCREQQVVGRHLGGDVDALRFGPSEQCRRIQPWTGGVSAREPTCFGQQDIASDDGFLGDGRPSRQAQLAR